MTEDKEQPDAGRPDWGTGGREFKSLRSDQITKHKQQFTVTSAPGCEIEISPKQVQKSRSGAKSPEEVPKSNPDSFTWRNYQRAALLEHGADSPLPTRQLKRATAKEMGRLLVSKQKAEGRKARLIARRTRNRAEGKRGPDAEP